MTHLKIIKYYLKIIFCRAGDIYYIWIVVSDDNNIQWNWDHAVTDCIKYINIALKWLFNNFWPEIQRGQKHSIYSSLYEHNRFGTIAVHRTVFCCSLFFSVHIINYRRYLHLQEDAPPSLKNDIKNESSSRKGFKWNKIKCSHLVIIILLW